MSNVAAELYLVGLIIGSIGIGLLINVGAGFLVCGVGLIILSIFVHFDIINDISH